MRGGSKFGYIGNAAKEKVKTGEPGGAPAYTYGHRKFNTVYVKRKLGENMGKLPR